ncbi:hypothetical protein C7972_1188 [Arenibacter sp. ARW7G5Y1]|nr:hypothetical protein C7972_1188 [Arenibacter sp. ARW7G5Y1]
MLKTGVPWKQLSVRAYFKSASQGWQFVYAIIGNGAFRGTGRIDGLKLVQFVRGQEYIRRHMLQ